MGIFKKKKQEKWALSKPLNHVAFIMDGNGRWAKKRLLPRHLGHQAGINRILEIAEACQEFGVQVMSLYAFSTENWKRPQDEIDHLFNYLDIFFNREIDRLMRDGVQVRTMGDISRLPEKTLATVNKAKEMTKNNKKFVLNICLNYGSRPEIVKAARDFASDVVANKLKIEDLTETKFLDYLYSYDLPEVDLLIRTSGENRLSNFMLYQLAYSEFVFTKTQLKRRQFFRTAFKNIKQLGKYQGGKSHGPGQMKSLRSLRCAPAPGKQKSGNCDHGNIDSPTANRQRQMVGKNTLVFGTGLAFHDAGFRWFNPQSHGRQTVGNQIYPQNLNRQQRQRQRQQ
ncbi:MAG: di-trans,poly-cis-decaprenylcistransferase [Methanomicrobia archaeon]|nr:di-trans,poly-cis-decaprenylcistransferase [Methanomicrobia archaeon]